MSPENAKWDRPMSSKRQKATSAIPSREGRLTPRGLRARHAFKGNKVNVGDPGSSSKEVLADKRKSKEAEKKRGERPTGSQRDHSTSETSNDGGGKDPR